MKSVASLGLPAIRQHVQRNAWNAPRIVYPSTVSIVARNYSSRPDLKSMQREDKAHGPVPGAEPAPETGGSRSTATTRVLVPSVALVLGFMGWWFFINPSRDHRKSIVNVGEDADNKLKGAKYRAAKQIENGERDPNSGELLPGVTPNKKGLIS
ncbi:hypothetical protein IE53DRAFT_386431 [Violaceomyces palustris]|uniref:Uncharacterized protein n=1 Tax=Violaceomyces palustris TaxID=1673888 RepID=A0ACD0NZI1_9BASI|nr:hypothetical protein IE53DRAFT_386431 [Violaceomyces palustris]